MTIGESLKRLRTSLGLSQKRFAESLGLACSLYQYYERDQTIPSAKVIIKIADVYGVSTDYLLGRSDMPNRYYDEREVKEAFAAREELNRLRSIIVPAMANRSGAIAQ